MPDMDGLTALPLLLQRKPGTNVLVASTLSRRGAEVSLRALTLGAADYVTKPETTEATGLEQFRADLIAKVRQLGTRKSRYDSGPSSLASASPVAAPHAARPAPALAAAPTPAAAPARRSAGQRPYSMAAVKAIFIGSSTGGPQAVTRLMKDLGPAMANLPVLIAQHMPPMFTSILAGHIAKTAGRPTVEGADNMRIQPGHIYVAPGGFHMVVARSADGPVIRILDTPPVNFCKPAVDPLFDSAAEIFGAGVLGVVLTGMGSDAAKGAKRIADSGGTIIAQDEETSVVWGMPGATVAIGACADVLPIGDIGPRIARLLMGAR